MKGAVPCALGVLACCASVSAQSPVPVPVALTLGAVSNQSVRLSWPASATGFVLEETGALGEAAIWKPVSETPALQNNQLSVSVGATEKSRSITGTPCSAFGRSHSLGNIVMR